MKITMDKSPILQIAGVTTMAEAMMLAASGITHLGFPFRLDFHTEDLSEDEAASIIRLLPINVKPVLITYLNNAVEIAELMKRLGCGIVQLHGSISIGEIIKLKLLFPEIELWKSLVIGKHQFLEILQLIDGFTPVVDAFITDTFDPATGASGATGKTHDWNLSQKIVKHSSKPVIIAGGLNPANVRAAILQIRPAGVDVHTGVEGLDGIKDKATVEYFVKEALQAFGKFSQTR